MAKRHICLYCSDPDPDPHPPPIRSQTYCNKLLEAGLVIMNIKQEHNTRCRKTSSVVSEKIWNTLGDSNTCVAWEKGQWQWLIMVLWNNWAVEYECDKIKYKVWYRSASCFEFRCAEDYPFSPNVVWNSLVLYLFVKNNVWTSYNDAEQYMKTFQVGNMVYRKKRGKYGLKADCSDPDPSHPLFLQSGTRLIATRAGYSGRISVFWPFIFSLWMPLIIQDCNAGRSNNLCRGRR